MPIVHLRYDPTLVLYQNNFWDFTKKLPAIIAEALDVPENPNARLKPEDIEISLIPHRAEDVNVKPLEIMVFAHEYPERAANLDARIEQICAAVRPQFDATSLGEAPGWVLIFLGKIGLCRL